MKIEMTNKKLSGWLGTGQILLRASGRDLQFTVLVREGVNCEELDGDVVKLSINPRRMAELDISMLSTLASAIIDELQNAEKTGETND